MADTDTGPDSSRDDLVAFLAERLGVPHEVALATLGNWLLSFERIQPVAERTAKPGD